MSSGVEEKREFTRVAAEFWRVHNELISSPSLLDTIHSTPEPQFPHYANRYPANSSHHYGGCIPLSPLKQTPCLTVQASPVWRRDLFVRPKKMPCFSEILDNAASYEFLGES